MMSREPISLKDILEYLGQKHGMQQLALAVDDCFKAWFKREKADSWKGSEEYLEHYSARTLHGKILGAADSDENPSSQLAVADLVDFVRRVRMPPERLLAELVSGAPFPFERFRQGNIVRVYVAKRMAKNVDGQAEEAGWQRAVHGSRDVLAVADLINVLGRDLQLEYELDLVPVSPASGEATSSMSKDDSPEEVLQKHITDKRTGAIVSLGSGPHNRISNEIAKRIFDDCGNDLPVRFRWTKNDRRQIDFLNETDELRKHASKHEAGIWYLSDGQVAFLYRETDTFIRDYRANKQEPKRTYFYDCGMLAIDVRGRVPLILAAGHGGNATRACVQALGHTDVIAKVMKKPSMEGRFVGCLVVARRKSPEESVDDLKLPDKGTSWYLFNIEDPPETYGLCFVEPILIRQ